jgi:pimeloyl-ACP methyl ester carboxylesterase
MTTFVIVHGGWGGGWEWTPVARRLRAKGHDVFTVTLTGLGDRAHLAGAIGLSTHIDDVLAVLEFEQLRDVVLCGHSYGGMVVTGAADRAPDRIRAVIYADAIIPRDGDSVRDFFPELVDSLIASAAERGDSRAPIAPEVMPPPGRIDEDVRAHYIARVRPHPVRTMTDSIRLSGAVEQLPRAYVHCTGFPDVPGEDMMAQFEARARAEGWPCRNSATPHDLQLYDPDGTASVLDELARCFDDRRV